MTAGNSILGGLWQWVFSPLGRDRRLAGMDAQQRGRALAQDAEAALERAEVLLTHQLQAAGEVYVDSALEAERAFLHTLLQQVGRAHVEQATRMIMAYSRSQSEDGVPPLPVLHLDG